MQVNINKSTQDIIDELRKDVNDIRENMDKTGERFEEAEGRISAIEDRMNNYEDSNTEVETLSKTLETAIENYDKDACTARRNNVIVHGLPGESKEPLVAMETFRSLCIEKLGFSEEWVEKVDLKETYRIPPKKTPGKPTGKWPLFVAFNKSIQRDEFYRAAPKLKDTGIVIRNDLAPCLIVKRNKLIKQSLALRHTSINYETKLRDTSFRVWLMIKKPGSDKWEPLDEKSEIARKTAK